DWSRVWRRPRSPRRWPSAPGGAGSPGSGPGGSPRTWPGCAAPGTATSRRRSGPSRGRRRTDGGHGTSQRHCARRPADERRACANDRGSREGRGDPRMETMMDGMFGDGNGNGNWAGAAAEGPASACGLDGLDAGAAGATGGMILEVGGEYFDLGPGTGDVDGDGIADSVTLADDRGLSIYADV